MPNPSPHRRDPSGTGRSEGRGRSARGASDPQPSPCLPVSPEGRGFPAAGGPHALIFDLGNVVLPFDHLRACRAAARKSPLGPEEIYHRLWASDLVAQFDRGAIGARAFFAAVRRLIDYRGSFSDLRRAWTDIFRPSPPMERLLAGLRGRYRLVLLSNTNRPHFEHVRRRYAVVRLFRRRVLSFEVGLLKPDPRIYRLAVAKAGSTPAECLYVDDNPDFVRAAGAVGLRGVAFRGARRLRADLAALGVRSI